MQNVHNKKRVMDVHFTSVYYCPKSFTNKQAKVQFKEQTKETKLFSCRKKGKIQFINLAFCRFISAMHI